VTRKKGEFIVNGQEVRHDEPDALAGYGVNA
jgi:hypothetical protein